MTSHHISFVTGLASAKPVLDFFVELRNHVGVVSTILKIKNQESERIIGEIAYFIIKELNYFNPK